MSAKAATTKIAEALRGSGRRVEGLTMAPRPHAAVVRVSPRNQDNFIAKNKGEWYLHTLMGR